MKNKAPLIRTTLEEYMLLSRQAPYSFKTSLTKKMVKILPGAYESSTGTMLIFPHDKCPKQFRFRPRWRIWYKPVYRNVVNIMAVKNEDLSESLIIRLK